MATSIWSSETLAGLLAAAMRPAVSPAWTRTWPPPAETAGAARRWRGGRGCTLRLSGRWCCSRRAADRRRRRRLSHGWQRRAGQRRLGSGGRWGWVHTRCNGNWLWRWPQVGRIKKEGVVANDPARRPVGFDDQVHERFVDRTGTGQTEKGSTIGPLLKRNLQPSKRCVHFHAGTAERFRRSQPHPKAGGFFGVDVGHLDLRPKRLTQGGLHHHTPQCQRLCCTVVRQRGTQQGGRSDCLQATQTGDLSHLARRLKWGRAGFEWHLDLEGKNLILTLTSTDYGDKLRIRLSFPAHRSSCLACPFALLTCNEAFPSFSRGPLPAGASAQASSRIRSMRRSGSAAPQSSWSPIVKAPT